jgi:phosphonopyruvate decarboxylase
MIDIGEYGSYITSQFGFFTGVPDSLLKELCSYLAANVDEDKNITAVNEGSAVALASGYFLASGKCAVVYMQNSGMGNALNPLLSLADPLVFSIPMLLLIGWRGEPGFKDEPQHAKQGLVTKELLMSARVRHTVHEDTMDGAREQIEEAMEYMTRENAPYALIVRQNTFSPFKGSRADTEPRRLGFEREEAIEEILNCMSGPELFISTTGKISRELYELRKKRGEGHDGDFLTVGSMGHASQIAAAVSLSSGGRRIICLDGDGAVLMHMGGLATIGVSKANILHIVLNNGAHDSVGGQPTIAQKINLSLVASACGYVFSRTVTSRDELKDALGAARGKRGPSFIETIVDKGARGDLGRPTQAPARNKLNFMRCLAE